MAQVSDDEDSINVEISYDSDSNSDSDSRSTSSNSGSQSETKKKSNKQGTQPIQDLLKYTQEAFDVMQKLEIRIQSEGKSVKKTNEYT